MDSPSKEFVQLQGLAMMIKGAVTFMNGFYIFFSLRRPRFRASELLGNEWEKKFPKLP